MAAARTSAFRGRAPERQALDDLLDRVRGGESAVLVIRGEAGIGKTALMHYFARQASGCRLVQIDGVESEMELPLAALHQLCTPMLSCLATLPEPQQRALRVAFGLAEEPAPDRFVLGLAVLSLRAEMPPRARWSAWSMTPSGWIKLRPRCSGLSGGGYRLNRLACCWPSGRQPANGYFPACRR